MPDLGSFGSEEEAARAHDAAIRKHFDHDENLCQWWVNFNFPADEWGDFKVKLLNLCDATVQ